MASRALVIESVWQGLQGKWRLRRQLKSANALEPSGSCLGEAAFTSREPSVFVDGDGQLQTAVKEMVYTEKGEFEMQSQAQSPVKFPFSRKYIWRLQDMKEAQSQITIWFAKPGSEQVDYLFHRFSIQDVSEKVTQEQRHTMVECTGGHLCVEDFYSSSYCFSLAQSSDTSIDHDWQLHAWTMLHEVRGPKKDQLIETAFSRFDEP